MVGRKIIVWMVLGAVAFSFAVPGFAADRWSRGVLPVGTQAPEFSLPRLSITADSKGELSGSISEETVSLSALTNKQAVVLFFSSYT